MPLKSYPFRQNFFSVALLSILTVIFLFSLFANLSHPLLWNDEGTTAVAGERVLKFGYPKVHDGKNVLYDLNHPDYSIGIDNQTDAFIADANWAMYYVAAAGVKVASFTDDIYMKTAILRFPFALLGFIGLALLAWNTSLFFSNKKSGLKFLIAFASFSLLSVPLILHLREVRYYSLLIFFLACAISIFCSGRIRHSISQTKYCILMIPILMGLFFSFPPVFFMFYVDCTIFLAALYAYRFYQNSKSGVVLRENVVQIFSSILKSSLPFITSLLFLIPAILYFKLFELSNQLSAYYGFNFYVYKENLTTIWDFLSSYDFLIAVIAVKSVTMVFTKKIFQNKNNIPPVLLSSFLSIIFLVHFFLVAKIPTYIFTRYFIVLTPILTCILLLDISTLWTILQQGNLKRIGLIKTLAVLLIILLMARPVSRSSAIIKDHWYETTHENKGCLEFAIDYIKTNYPHPDSLVISTNYEEPVLMYYLQSKVILGYIKNNLQYDTLLQPDIIIYRKGWAWRDDAKIFQDQLSRASYDSVLFPVLDYPVNTIAEIVTPWQGLGHLFRTPYNENPAEQLKIYIKRKDITD
ncbi:MAG: hypothetical protein ABI763_02750 [Bacteroidota bacterium]